MNSQINIKTTCRTCMQSTEDGRQIFADFEDTTIASVLAECTAVQIINDESLPNQICNKCFTELSGYVEFIKRARETDKQLRKLLKKPFDNDKRELSVVLTDILKQEQRIKSEEEISDIDHNESVAEDSVLPASKSFYMMVELNSPKKATRSRKIGRKAKPKPEPEPDILDEIEQRTFAKIEIPPGHSVCCGCFQSFASMEDLLQHGSTSHSKNRPINTIKEHVCKICFRRYLTQRAITEHRDKIQQMVIYECSICQMRYTQANKRRLHAHNHDKQAQFLSEEAKAQLGKICCAVTCNESFPTEELLIQHARTAHKFNAIEAKMNFSEERPIGCDICHKHFSTEQGLEQHRIRKYLPRKHQCSICGEKFLAPSAVVEHELTHRNEKDVQCQVCPKRFYTAKQLREHMRKHFAPPKFVCSLCGKAFKQSNTLNAHMLAHEGKLPYVCDVCNKAFRVKNKLQYHMRTHTGERPYPCRYCEAAFAESTNRMRHELIHLKEKNLHQE
ncbi:zinc finger protein OZF-like [Topomyia yanbarensis]|uniref:zinc finger protein OZF-like n=1 Tax=Topomyia yanbarensis TaxID=2498891 RepID=UPI00273BAC72|nr:zinc finger protein OZF-like [Topomyia yanbarensis]